jgi:hypothetical protein
LSEAIASFDSRFAGIDPGLIALPFISVDAAYDVPPSARNSASSAMP